MAFWSVHCLILRFLCRVSNANSSPSSIVVTSSTPGTSQSLPSLSSCTFRPLVRIRALHNPAATLWTNIVNIGMGILVLYETSQPASATWAILLLRYSIPWISVAVSLNAILTLMIVLRLFLGSRNVRAVTGSPSQISGLYVAVATMFIESCALYTVNSLVLLGLWVTNSDVAGAFIIILSEIQVCDSPRLRPPG